MRQRTGKKVKGIHNYMSTKRLNNKEYINLAESCNRIINENEDAGKHDSSVPYEFEWDDLVRTLQADPGSMDWIMDTMGPVTSPPPVGWFNRWNKSRNNYQYNANYKHPVHGYNR